MALSMSGVYNLHKLNLIQVQLIRASFSLHIPMNFSFFSLHCFLYALNCNYISSIKIRKPFMAKWFVFQLIDIAFYPHSSHIDRTIHCAKQRKKMCVNKLIDIYYFHTMLIVCAFVSQVYQSNHPIGFIISQKIHPTAQAEQQCQ